MQRFSRRSGAVKRIVDFGCRIRIRQRYISRPVKQRAVSNVIAIVVKKSHIPVVRQHMLTQPRYVAICLQQRSSIVVRALNAHCASVFIWRDVRRGKIRHRRVIVVVVSRIVVAHDCVAPDAVCVHKMIAARVIEPPGARIGRALPGTVVAPHIVACFVAHSVAFVDGLDVANVAGIVHAVKSARVWKCGNRIVAVSYASYITFRFVYQQRYCVGAIFLAQLRQLCKCAHSRSQISKQ